MKTACYENDGRREYVAIVEERGAESVVLSADRQMSRVRTSALKVLRPRPTLTPCRALHREFLAESVLMKGDAGRIYFDQAKEKEHVGRLWTEMVARSIKEMRGFCNVGEPFHFRDPEEKPANDGSTFYEIYDHLLSGRVSFRGVPELTYVDHHICPLNSSGVSLPDGTAANFTGAGGADLLALRNGRPALVQVQRDGYFELPCMALMRLLAALSEMCAQHQWVRLRIHYPSELKEACAGQRATQ